MVSIVRLAGPEGPWHRARYDAAAHSLLWLPLTDQPLSSGAGRMSMQHRIGPTLVSGLGATRLSGRLAPLHHPRHRFQDVLVQRRPQVSAQNIGIQAATGTVRPAQLKVVVKIDQKATPDGAVAWVVESCGGVVSGLFNEP